MDHTNPNPNPTDPTNPNQPTTNPSLPLQVIFMTAFTAAKDLFQILW